MVKFIFLWLTTQFFLQVVAMGSDIYIPVCEGFDGNFPNESVHCNGYSVQNPACTNPKECCRNKYDFGSFNKSVLQAYDLWRPPPVPPREIDRVCSLKTNLFEFSKENNTDKASDGHVFVQHKAFSLTHCSDFCLREPRCSGFNLATVPDPEVKKLCELLDEVGNIIDRPGFSFWHFDRFAYEKVNTRNFSYNL